MLAGFQPDRCVIWAKSLTSLSPGCSPLQIGQVKKGHIIIGAYSARWFACAILFTPHRI